MADRRVIELAFACKDFDLEQLQVLSDIVNSHIRRLTKPKERAPKKKRPAPDNASLKPDEYSHASAAPAKARRGRDE